MKLPKGMARLGVTGVAWLVLVAGGCHSHDGTGEGNSSAENSPPSPAAAQTVIEPDGEAASAQATTSTQTPSPVISLDTPVAAQPVEVAEAGPRRLKLMNGSLEEVAAFGQNQVTGVAVTGRGRVFVSFPRWEAPYRMGVGEVMADGSLVAYPNVEWNRFGEDAFAPPMGDCYVCVQSLHIDAKGRMWVLDPAAPKLSRIVRMETGGGGPKLIEIDTTTNEVARVIRFDAAAAPDGAYLNDVRVDTRDDTAFITDSGLGAIVVVDLSSGRARRLLADHASTKAEPGFVPLIGGRELRTADGKAVQVHADGIALDVKGGGGGYLYWQALTGRHLYRIDVRLLKSETAAPFQVGNSVQDLGQTVVTDGMEVDAFGNVYFTALEHDSIMMRTSRGTMRTVMHDPMISWPDSIAIGPRGPVGSGESVRPEKYMYFTTSQIHAGKPFTFDGSMPTEPYRLWRVRMPRE